MRRLCVVTALLLIQGLAQAAEFISIATGSTSGVYYPVGVALSRVYADVITDAHVQVQSTKGSVENLNLLQKRRVEVALSLADTVKLAWDGDAEAGFPRPLDHLRVLAALYPGYVQVVALSDAAVSSVEQLAGKRMSVGAPKSGTELNARAIMTAAGISYDDFERVEYLPFAESAELMRNRQLDASLQTAGLGVASIKDLAINVAVDMVNLSPELIQQLGEPYRLAIIPAGTYRGQSTDITTAAIPNLLLTHDEVSDELAYRMTKGLFDHLHVLRAAHSAANGIELNDAVSRQAIPLHPGAARFYREKGLL